MSLRRQLLAAAVLACTLHCSGTPRELPEDPAEAEAFLRTCPAGDDIWRQAVRRLRGEEDLKKLQALAGEIAESCPERWEPRWTLGETLYFASQLPEARSAYRTAMERARELGDMDGVACVGNRLGSLGYLGGELDVSRDQFLEALEAARQAERRDLESFVLNNLAGVLRKTGDLAGAADALGRASRLMAELGNLDQPSRDAAYNRAVLLLELGDVTGASEAFERVYTDCVEADDVENASMVGLAYGNLFLRIGDPRAARVWFERAVHDTAQIHVVREMGLGRIDLAAGELDSAERRLTEALAVATESGLAIDALLAEAWHSRVLWRQGQLDEAQAGLERVAGEAERIGAEQKATWFSRWLLGRIHEERGDLNRAETSLRAAVEVLEAQSRELDPGSSGLHFLLERTDPYADLAIVLSKAGRRDELFDVVELAHARSLRDVRQRERGAAVDTTGAGEAAGVSLAAVRQSLGQDELLLDYVLGRERGMLVAVTRGTVRALPIAGWEELSGPLERYREALERPLVSFAARADAMADLDRDIEAGHALRRALLDPVRDLIAGARRLYVVPDRGLALLPFAALPLDEADAGATVFLGDRLETAVMPMAGPVPDWPGGRGPILLAGNPGADAAGRFAALPRTAVELETLRQIWRETSPETLGGAEFTRKRFLDLPLDRFHTLHLATHAVASSLDPRRNAVVFSGGELLGFDEVSRLPLSPSLVVLSACSSGEGEAIPGQGVVGLGWAFLLAGARGLAVSLWSIDDAAAADLMGEFHRRLHAGDDPVRALAAGARWLRAERPHPAFWSPFVIYVTPGITGG